MPETKYLKITDLSTESANAMFDAICGKILKVAPSYHKNRLGVPRGKPATYSELLSLLRHTKVKMELKVTYECTEEDDKLNFM
jgi:hypothetical protein